MKHHHPKRKQPLFSCGFFRYCTTQSVLSPTNTNPPVLPLSDPPPPPPKSESSSSSNTSQSFTQWRFSNTSQLHQSSPTVVTIKTPEPQPPAPVIISDLQELYHVAELQLSTGEESDIIKAIYMLQHNLVTSRAVGGASVTCPPAVMQRVLSCLKDKDVAKPATKVLLALCLVESNRHVAVEEGAVGKVVEALVDLDGGAVAERALAALELLCTVAEGAAELRAHALVGPMMVEVMRRMETTRGRENAIGILAVIYGDAGGDEGGFAPQEEVARVVMLAMQGDCSARGRRKGAQLLKMLQENERLDLTQEVG
ncbi:U-box domain-containing protein 25-like [Bidens hawaiensis]|uniref:U-box domain-containing protein 25-like n=1 Tax=Bidens hawaiensis TaxID=980011 RepID=UPI00404B5BAD